MCIPSHAVDVSVKPKQYGNMAAVLKVEVDNFHYTVFLSSRMAINKQGLTRNMPQKNPTKSCTHNNTT